MSTRSDQGNGLLRSISAFVDLDNHLQLVELSPKMVLVPLGQRTEFVYFLESGLASIVAETSDGESIEVGHIGSEGMSGAHIVLDFDFTPNRTFVQIEGTALRMPAADFSDMVDTNAQMRKMMLRYVHTCAIQLSHSAIANGRYSLHERLARWLLMCHDRLDGDDVPLTHEFLSLMLGVRRSGVTNEIHVMEGRHLIKATRAHIKILDRDRLREIAGGAYGVAEREYARLIGPHGRHVN